MKIFGIGLSKTGTNSLTKALALLGYNAVHFEEPLDMIEFSDDQTLIDLEKFNQYDAFTDTPIALSYKQLDQAFPHSKFILTTRDTKTWLRSCERNFGVFSTEEYSRLMENPRKVDLLHMKIYNDIHYDKDKFRCAYNRHIEEVKSYFSNREDDLLTLDIISGEGWENLCPFLGKKVPNEPFPKLHITPRNIFVRKWNRFKCVISKVRGVQ